ncbi:hypothetical protein N336_03035, partial [Phalacrocorax carbo]
DLTSHVGNREASLGHVAVGVEDKQQLIVAGGDGCWALLPTPLPQQGPVLSTTIKGGQVVVVAAVCQAAPALQLHVHEEDLDAIAWGQLDAPLALEVVGVEVGILRAGEI